MKSKQNNISGSNFFLSVITIKIIMLILVILITTCKADSIDNDLSYIKGLELQRAKIRSLFLEDRNRDKGITDPKPVAITVSEFGFDPVDSTTYLQSAFDSGARYILINKEKGPWISKQLYIRSNTTVFFEEGSELVAKKGSFLGTSEAFINIIDIENVTIIGYGAKIKMNKKDYMQPPYKKGEWRHTININGSRNIEILGITASSSGGDGIYIGRGKIPNNEHILIKNVVLNDHYRQGISVICAQDLSINNTQITNTGGTPPEAGIDFEPNNPDERLVNCIVSDCIITNNAKAGVIVSVDSYNSTSMPFSISIERCAIQWNIYSIALLYVEKDTRGELRMTGNELFGILNIPEATEDLKIIKDF